MTNEEAIKILLDGLPLPDLRMRPKERLEVYNKYQTALFMAEKALKEKPQGEWIPVTTRPMTEEEEKDACERLGVDHLEDYEKLMFTCPLPDDGQEILISTHWGVSLDLCDIDPDYGYGLENNGDWDGVLAWMPLPKPYKKGGAE